LQEIASESNAASRARASGRLAAELALAGGAFFLLAKAGQFLTEYAGAIPLSPAAGVGLAAVLLCGLRVWPAISAAAFAAVFSSDVDKSTLEASLVSSSGVALGYTVEAAAGFYLTTLWSAGKRTFDTPGGVLRFAAIALFPSTMAGAAIMAGTASIVGHSDWYDFFSSWVTWWTGEAMGALVVTPVLVLWARYGREINAPDAAEAAAVLLLTGGVGYAAFGPLLPPPLQGAAAFALVMPFLWVTLRSSPPIAASASLILAGLATWGAVVNPHSLFRIGDQSFAYLALFVICTAVAGLALNAEITRRKRNETDLRRREQDLRMLFSEVSAGLAEMDSAGRFQSVNRRLCEIVHQSSDELNGLHIRDMVDPTDVASFEDRMQSMLETREGFVIENRWLLPDGSRIWVKCSFSLVLYSDGKLRLVTVVDDITARRRTDQEVQRIFGELEKLVHQRTAELEGANKALHAEVAQRKRVEEALKQDIAQRRKAEEARRESQRRFRLFMDAVTDYALCMLDCDGNITSWNTGARRIHQFGADEIIGRHFSQFYSEEEQQRGEPARALKIAAYEGKHVTEGWRMRRDRSLFWASVVIEAVRDENGALVGFAEITRDITERVQAEAALQRAKEQLAQSQKMEALGQLTGSIAHDFNNLLTIVSGHAQLLRRRLSDPRQLKAIDALQAAASRGESLTRQLLAFSRRQPLSPIVIDLRERIESVHAMLLGSLRGNIELSCNVPADLWPVEIDIAEFELALVNIAVNARDAMPGGGAITISARNANLGPRDKVDQLEGEFVALSVKDTGVGIAPDILPRVFEPFFTTKGVGKGTGLGLSQVYAFAHQSGGSVLATSTPGTGTTITIYLPRSRAQVVRSTKVVDDHSTIPGEGVVLIVEDNPEVAEVTASMVQQLGYRTVRAENAADALSTLQRDPTIKLVFSDIVMPGAMNGIALAQVIAKRHAGLPVVLTSGYADMVQAAEPQFVVLRKPFQLSALEKALGEVLQRHARATPPGRVVPFTKPQDVSG
jgi:PAS domain S-box-containing protein